MHVNKTYTREQSPKCDADQYAMIKQLLPLSCVEVRIIVAWQQTMMDVGRSARPTIIPLNP